MILILWIILQAYETLRSLSAENVIYVLLGTILYHAQSLLTFAVQLIPLMISLIICKGLLAILTFDSVFL